MAQILLRHREFPPEPFRKNDQIKASEREQILNDTCARVRAAGLFQTSRIVRMQRNSECFEGLGVALPLPAIAGKKTDEVSLRAQLAKDLHQAYFGPALISPGKVPVHNQNAQRGMGFVRLFQFF